jgi:hypothetical protein
LRYERDGFAVEVLIERGQPPPSWYEEEPDCPPGLDYYMKAFWQLSTERSIGFSVGPIPASKIEEYGERRGFDRMTLENFIYIIRTMDAAYLDWLTQEREKNRKRKK